MTTEITQCRDLLVRLTGRAGRYFRPSGTDDGTSTPAEIVLDLAGQAGYPVVLGFDSIRSTTRTQAPTSSRSAPSPPCTPGSIISLHFDHPGNDRRHARDPRRARREGTSKPGTASALLLA